MSYFWLYVSSRLSSSPLTLSFLWRTYQTNVFMSLCYRGKHHATKRKVASKAHTVSYDWIIHIYIQRLIHHFLDSSFYSVYLCSCCIFFFDQFTCILDSPSFLFSWWFSFKKWFVYTCVWTARWRFQVRNVKTLSWDPTICNPTFYKRFQIKEWTICFNVLYFS